MKIKNSIVTKVAKEAVEINQQIKTLKITKTKIKKEIPSEILKAVKMVGYIQALEEELGKAKKDLKETIKGLMANTQLAEIISEGYKATYTEFDSDTFDTTLFKKEHAKMYAKYLKTIEKTKFEVKAAKATK